MIFTECPYCDGAQCFAWECGDRSGFFPSKCSKCGKVMWVAAVSCGGMTISHENFITECAREGDEEQVERAAMDACVLNTLEYG